MEKIVSRFRDKLVKMIIDASSKLDIQFHLKLDEFYCTGVMN